MKRISQILIRSLACSCVIGLAFLTAAAQDPSDGNGTNVSATGEGSETAIVKKGSAKDKSSKAQENDTASLYGDFRLTLEVGGQWTNIEGERPSKFEQTKRVREGFLFRRFKASANPSGSPWFFNAFGRNPTESDQQYFLDVGKYGVFRTTIKWTQFQFLLSEGATSLFSVASPGVLTVPDIIQQTMEATPNANQPAVIQGFISTAPKITLRTQREKLEIGQRFNLTDKWVVRFDLSFDKKFGTRRVGIGAYERFGVVNGDTFRPRSGEIPEPIDSRAVNLRFGTGYVAEKWGINFDYFYSKYDNDIPIITFDNPFRFTDMSGTSNGGRDRQLFARGIIAREPSNHAYGFLVSGFVDLPGNTRIASAVGRSYFRQDEAFAPFSLNSAIVTSGLPAGTNITQTAALPQSSLNGEVDTFTHDHLLSTRPLDNLTFNLHFRSYDYDNNTASILFPGYAAYSESYWRTNIKGHLIENRPKSFLKKYVSGEVIWDVNRRVRVNGEYMWEGWDRDNREVDRTNEYGFKTKLRVKPATGVSSKIRYHFSKKTIGTYDSRLEFDLLRKFDQAERKRHDFDLQWQWNVDDGFGLSGTFGYLNDKYDKNFFGLADYDKLYASIEMLFMPDDKTTFYSNYTREQSNNMMQLLAKTGVGFNLNNRWNREQDDTLDSVSIGLTSYLGNNYKALLDIHYAAGLAKTKIDTTNPGTPLPGSVLNATAFPFPDVSSRYQEIDADFSYQVLPNAALGFRYRFEPYRLDDFAVNGLTAYPFSQFPSTQDGTRFLILDSRYSSHDVHLFGIYLRFDTKPRTN